MRHKNVGDVRDGDLLYSRSQHRGANQSDKNPVEFPRFSLAVDRFSQLSAAERREKTGANGNVAQPAPIPPELS